MSARDQIRVMVQQLMGTQSNGEDVRNNVKFTDSSVCKAFLLGCCPHEVFESTRMNLGACERIHEVALRTDYEKAQLSRDYGYEEEVKNYLKSFINDRDRRSAEVKWKLVENQEDSKKLLSEKENVVEELKTLIEQKIAEAERLGQEGLVEDSLKVTQEVDEFIKKKEEAELECRTAVPHQSHQQQKMRVCEVCTSYLGVQDNDRRLAEHFGGKLHRGYIFIQENFEKLQEKLRKKNDGKSTLVPRSAIDEEGADSYERPSRQIRCRERRGGGQRRERSRERDPSRSRSRNHDRSSRSGQRNSGYRRYRN